jgi:hypothetical protein
VVGATPSDAGRRDTLKQRHRFGELAGLRETGDFAHVNFRERVHDSAFVTDVDTGGMPGPSGRLVEVFRRCGRPALP